MGQLKIGLDETSTFYLPNFTKHTIQILGINAYAKRTKSKMELGQWAWCRSRERSLDCFTQSKTRPKNAKDANV